MKKHEQADLEKVMRAILTENKELARDERLKRAAKAGMLYCENKGFTAGATLALYDEKGHVTHELSGREALSYMLVGMADEMLNEEN